MAAKYNNNNLVQLRDLSDKFEKSTPQEILSWAIVNYPTITMATAFGAEGCAILSMLSELPGGKDVRIFNLDTGYQFPETIEMRDRIAERYGIDVEFVRPEETVEQMQARFGGPIYGTNPDECCRLRKIEPLKRALSGHEAWITGIRRDQTPDRAVAEPIEWDSRFGLIKVNPLAHWTRAEVRAYIGINDVIYNPLHDRGYPSIGCWPCTHQVAETDDERAGRWLSFAKVECGLHVKP